MEYPKTTGESYSKTIYGSANFMQLCAQQGWQCPICKRVLAPFVPECPCQGQGMQTITTVTTDTSEKTTILDLSKRPDLSKTSVKDYDITTTIYNSKGDAE